ncbi:hypothetical protein BVRB_034210 [Beta vulgaris subsp. vulgaris]|uniref:Transcription activator GCR1-like domain-containing protein n=1 Tax=Beta vulgaris subsp. vulgaris TaxID=3555 RepID=A0A0J7YVH9_BETVV|nr:hypothetical protein BVRB_034210 [Beta vulgaris subsp. vulgaris]
MSRGIRTVTDLWREWTEGLAGGPAVKDLIERLGTKWCQENERRFLNRRRVIINAVLSKARTIQGGETPGNCLAAAAILEHDRVLKGKSLDWLSKNINLGNL